MGIPAMLLSAPSSGQGKSIITAALARLHRNAGRRVRVFKHGPDYLDPMLQERASGAPVYQLHPWMTGAGECRARLAMAAREADVILVEGAMGLFDGDPSSADLAALAGLPVAVVVDARAMAETYGALVAGLARHRDDIQVVGALANRVDRPGHACTLAGSLPEGLAWLGAVPRAEALQLPDRHLGLVQADEVDDLDARLDAAAGVLAEAGLGGLPPAVALEAEPLPAPPRLLQGQRIAVARDAAFGFIYRANLELLEAMGATVCPFSPLRDAALPAADALWLPGGYPELYAAELAGNAAMQAAIRGHHEAGRPILAECGGLMYCAEALVTGDGTAHGMLGLLPGRAEMAGRLTGIGLQAWERAEGALRGHTFHHSRLHTALTPAAETVRRSGSPAEAVYRVGSLTATYFHAYFPSSPEVVAALLTR
ncbi:MAG: cobyrinate a,c-diamide synthase [Halorhodospira sp.]